MKKMMAVRKRVGRRGAWTGARAIRAQWVAFDASVSSMEDAFNLSSSKYEELCERKSKLLESDSSPEDEDEDSR